MGLSDVLSRMQAHIFGLLPGKLFTMDNYYSLQKDSVCLENYWDELGITPTAIESVVPMMLGNLKERRRYQGWRRSARRG